MSIDTKNLIQTPKLPSEASQYLWSAEVFDVLDELIKDAGVGEDKTGKLHANIFRLCEGGIASGEFMGVLSKEIGIDESVSKKLSLGVMTRVLLKIEGSLPFNIRDQIKMLGGTGEEAVETKQLDIGTYVKTYVSQLPDTIENRLKHRIEDILMKYTSGENSHEETLERFTRSEKLNGMGIELEDAREVLAAFDEDRIKNKIEIQKREVVVSGQDVVLEKCEHETQAIADEEEIAKFRESKRELFELKGPVEIETVVTTVCENKAFQFDSPILQDRCKKIVESRVRGVRDAGTTREQLERSVDKGGLGVTGRKLSDMLEIIEGQVVAYERETAKKHTEEKTSIQVKKKELEIAKTENAKREEKIMTKRYVELTGKIPTSHVSPTSVPLSRVSGAVSIHHELQQREGKIDTQKVRSIIEQAKQPKQAVSQGTNQASMQEIVFEKRLSGPIDELSRMNLTDFRRLSSDPKHAATKIKDKIELIEQQEGYEKKIKAIQAWQLSPLIQTYLKLSREAVMKSLPPFEVLAEYRLRKEDVMSDEEFKTVMQLNADLRF